MRKPVKGAANTVAYSRFWFRFDGSSSRIRELGLRHCADTVKPQHYCDGGLTYLISSDVQWDIRAGLGLNDAADDFFVGTGLSIRFR